MDFNYFNSHYAAVSTDKGYLSQSKKQTTATADFVYLTDWQVFRILDTLKPTCSDWLRWTTSLVS